MREPVQIFISYSHQDEPHRRRLETHLAMLKSEGRITSWSDRRIQAGADWDREIDHHINSAHVILLLVSPDFIASRYCFGIELRRALERRQAGQAEVLPIIVRPCDWMHNPLAGLQALPQDGKPITKWRNKDDAWLDVVRGLREVVEALETRWLMAHPSVSTDPPPSMSESASPQALGSSEEPTRAHQILVLLLDRTKQWETLKRECDRNDSTLFILSGHESQYLRYFAVRIKRYLAEEREDHHCVVMPSFAWEYMETPSPELLEQQLHKELARELGAQGGTLETLFHQITERRPLLIIAGRAPLRDLAPEQEEALQDFLTVRVPRLRRGARHPVRVLVAVEYGSSATSLTPIVNRWTQVAWKKGEQKIRLASGEQVVVAPLRPCLLADVDTPTAEDVEAYLRHHHQPRLSEAIIERIVAFYRREILATPGRYSFADLTTRLEEKIEEARDHEPMRNHE